MIDWRIYERDVDIILAEEFYASRPFANWFLSQTRSFGDQDASVTEVCVSLSDEKGESDLVIVFETADKSKFALLIEDKIDAPFQLEQVARYRLRGQGGIEKNQWQQFDVILCAPQAYIDQNPTSSQFDVAISYESLADRIKYEDSGRRGEYRADFLNSAASKRSTTYVKKTDASTDAFWGAAFELSHAEFPELAMRDVQYASNSTWITLRPGWVPVGIYIYLKGNAGHADLTFTRVEIGDLEVVIGERILPGMIIEKTGASAAIRLTFPPFAVSEGLAIVNTKVRAALIKCRSLLKFYKEHRDILENLVMNYQRPSAR